jgi:integration host factor subunit alpha
MNRTITRHSLVGSLRQEAGLSREECADLLEQTLNAIGDRLAQNEPIKLTKFGTFSVRFKRDRVGRNPRTGDEHPILSRNVVVFRPSQAMKRRIDRPR